VAGAAGGGAAAVVLTPSHSGHGTNGAALAPPAAMPLTFGEPSFENHLRTARERGLVPQVLTLPGLGLDIDGPADLALLLARGPQTESGRLLARWSIADRLTAVGGGAR
jgi:2-phospho-L-lactate guanylyltransferase